MGKGGSQKAHVLSPLDIRLSAYLMAMYNFNFNSISDLIEFNDLSKDRYLFFKVKSYYEKSILDNIDNN